MPGISTVEKLTDTRCYYNYTFYGKFCSEERIGYRSFSQIISLKVFNVKEDNVKIYWKLSKDNKDMIGNIITVGAKVVGEVDKSFQLGEVIKINSKTCRVIIKYRSYIKAIPILLAVLSYISCLYRKCQIHISFSAYRRNNPQDRCLLLLYGYTLRPFLSPFCHLTGVILNM